MRSIHLGLAVLGAALSFSFNVLPAAAAAGRAKEAALTPVDLETADKVFLGNSVRGLMVATFVIP